MAAAPTPRSSSSSSRSSSRTSPGVLLVVAVAAAAALLFAPPTSAAPLLAAATAENGPATSIYGAWGWQRWLPLPLMRGGGGGALRPSVDALDDASAAPATAGGGAVRRLARRLLSPWVARGVSRPICNSPAVLCSSAWSLDGTWVKASYKIAENEPKAGGGGGAGRSGAFLGAAVSRG
ncbi:hypothetical protein HYH02_000038 [Chlamydomonas schloesseri]|uniref:Uncharacterized protein n=1 Tax=Chlamydomonas schloesseri TaxID=2026947 RepID=A0A836B811_9CHLO|nr:hypothetical protein HYH02_000038 [Chlamydomonas schloesseri]|eukprot:KAG2449934.1 hypothetical protein HYH02_000038 [Chlamydomonas schloesseri]